MGPPGISIGYFGVKYVCRSLFQCVCIKGYQTKTPHTEYSQKKILDMIQAIKPQQFRSLKLAADAVVLDVRSGKEQYEDGQIPGNIHLELGTADFEQALERLDKNKRYLVYCRSGNRSMKACQTMQQRGFDQLYSLEGGITSWKAAFVN